MKTISIPDATPAYDGSTLKSAHRLSLTGTYYRFGIGGVPRGHAGRKVSGGPLVDGPWAYTFGLASVMAANPEQSTGAERRRNVAAGIEHDVADGDRVIFDGVTYAVRVVRRQWIELDRVETPEQWTAEDAAATPETAYDALQRLVGGLAADLPGVTFGYTGNVGTDRSGRYDDRSWAVYLPHPGRVGVLGDWVSLGSTAKLPAAVERWPSIEAEARRLYAARDRSGR